VVKLHRFDHRSFPTKRFARGFENEEQREGLSLNLTSALPLLGLALSMSAMALAMTDSGKQLQRAECNKLKEGDEVYYWSDTNSTWIRTSFIRVCSDNANIVRLQSSKIGCSSTCVYQS
jgi:hypothetical protein